MQQHKTHAPIKEPKMMQNGAARVELLMQRLKISHDGVAQIQDLVSILSMYKIHKSEMELLEVKLNRVNQSDITAMKNALGETLLGAMKAEYLSEEGDLGIEIASADENTQFIYAAIARGLEGVRGSSSSHLAPSVCISRNEALRYTSKSSLLTAALQTEKDCLTQACSPSSLEVAHPVRVGYNELDAIQGSVVGNLLGSVILDGKATKRAMLAAELPASLRWELLRERKQISCIVDAFRKRGNTADVAQDPQSGNVPFRKERLG